MLRFPVKNGSEDSISAKKIPEIRAFDDFVTVDWVEEDEVQIDSDRQQILFRSNYVRYTQKIWAHVREIATLALVAIVLGLVAGTLQIGTETLVNWKSGHCARNWFLNRSFCCAAVKDDTKGRLVVRDELECVEQGIWVAWQNPFGAFLLFMTLSLVFGLLSAILVRYVAPMAGGSGISEIKVWVSGFKYKDEFLGLKTLIIKSIALPLAISSGLSVGKEGPSVHYATCIGFVVTNLLSSRSMHFSEQTEYLIAASAGGVSVAFGSPIGGVLFALEEMCTNRAFNLSIMWKSYFIALAAVTTLQYMDPFRNGKIVLFEVTYDNQWLFSEIPVFVLLGVFGGLYGHFISNWNIHFVSFRRKYLSNSKIREVLILIIMTALVSYFNEFLKLDMTESMGVLFHECSVNGGESAWSHEICQLDADTHVAVFLKIFLSLCAATIIRSILIVFSYGACVPAGIFVPSMAVGATFGRAVSLFVERFITGANVITPGTYAFLGAAATLSGITNLTLTVVVIMVELTGAFSYVIPLMIVAAVTTVILSSLGSKAGIADKMILFNGFPLLEKPKHDMTWLREYTAADVMTTSVVTMNEIISTSALKALLETYPNFSGFPVVADGTRQKLRGYASRSRLMITLITNENDGPSVDILRDTKTLGTQDDESRLTEFRKTVNELPLTVKPATPFSQLFRVFEKLGSNVVLVEEEGSFLGLISTKDLMKFQRLKEREMNGQLFNFNEERDEKLWSFIRLIF
ncbi:LAMI_0H06656g1_1 [Lachancea mirantina]|uniref:Chloride channel protein n=1 Tax=Lachancea mirantina TaxID=1230905 RepID=A0A1G4KFA7_9SACH|nr:LAMI_0H06656g1_1 [Lachancea mirantina]